MKSGKHGGKDGRTVLLDVLSGPECLKHLTLEDWNVLIPQARSTGLMGRLAVYAEGIPEGLIPVEVRWHLKASHVMAESHAAVIKWETNRLDRALARLGIPVVLLKGPASMVMGLPWGRGRICRDIDLLVARDQLADVERCLLAGGWEAKAMEPRQERFFRKWLHEIPAVSHRERGIEVDVHHNILPLIDSIRIDSDVLVESSLPLDGYRCMRVLAQDDRLLHSAAHLFRRGFYQNGLRDLADMDGMIRAYACDADWDRLLNRAAELRLGGPLFLAFRYTAMFLGTPVPRRMLSAIREWKSRWPPLWVLDRLVKVAVLPPRLDGWNRWRTVTHWVLERYPLCLMRKTILPKLGVAPFGGRPPLSQRFMAWPRKCGRQEIRSNRGQEV
jgi:hypothetical protein